ncbi:MAG: polymer-forming cytoskeletal protein [Caenispirillum bisanense]|nr:polymer-forming cytoskeletal protein [Caenispirillum bisanense]MCA1974496.1 polymer-forming cytoskeletal protein [Caenispirillum sp.]
MTASRSHFAADLIVTGSVSGPGRLQIDGRVDGDVSVGTLAVGGRGSLIGSVTAEQAEVAGSVTGALRAATVTVADGGFLSGVVEYQRLGVAVGGRFEAECRPTTAPALQNDGTGSPARPARPLRARLVAG